MRIYDTRVGRFLSIDPLFKDYAELTPYQFASNNPVRNIDIDGLEGMAGNLINPGKWHVAGDANDNGLVDANERRDFGKMMALNAKMAIYGTVAIFQPEIGIPLIVADISGAPVTPSPQAFAGSAASQALRQSDVALDEAAENVTATTGTAGNNLSRGNTATTVESTNTQASAANNGNNTAASSNTANRPGPP